LACILDIILLGVYKIVVDYWLAFVFGIYILCVCRPWTTMPVGMAFDLDARLSPIPVWRTQRLLVASSCSLLLLLHDVPPQFLDVWISIFELDSKISDWSNNQFGG
jgi:hypothetical protein